MLFFSCVELTLCALGVVSSLLFALLPPLGRSGEAGADGVEWREHALACMLAAVVSVARSPSRYRRPFLSPAFRALLSHSTLFILSHVSHFPILPKYHLGIFVSFFSHSQFPFFRMCHTFPFFPNITVDVLFSPCFPFLNQILDIWQKWGCDI